MIFVWLYVQSVDLHYFKSFRLTLEADSTAVLCVGQGLVCFTQMCAHILVWGEILGAIL